MKESKRKAYIKLIRKHLPNSTLEELYSLSDEKLSELFYYCSKFECCEIGMFSIPKDVVFEEYIKNNKPSRMSFRGCNELRRLTYLEYLYCIQNQIIVELVFLGV